MAAMTTEQLQADIEARNYELSFLYEELGKAVTFKAEQELEGKTTIRISRKADALLGAILNRQAEIEAR